MHLVTLTNSRRQGTRHGDAHTWSWEGRAVAVSCHSHEWSSFTSSPANRRKDLSFPKVPSVHNRASLSATGSGFSLPDWHTKQEPDSCMFSSHWNLPTETDLLKPTPG